MAVIRARPYQVPSWRPNRYGRNNSAGVHPNMTGLRTGDRVGYTATAMSDPPACSQITVADGPPPLPDGVWTTFSGGRLPFPVHLRTSRSEDGRLICTALVITPGEQEITARSLREIPLSQLLSRRGGRSANSESLGLSFAAAFMEALSPEFEGALARPGPQGHPREHFEGVAAAYREALIQSPRAPVQWLLDTETLHGSEATVRRWIRRARDMGLLGEAVPGRAGEFSKPKARRKRKGAS